MDDAVIKAMAKWPNVPDVHGWLGLDRRGRWRLQGEPVLHPRAIAFIDRNYTCDERGRWYFQNGPQKVFVALEYTPWILRLTGESTLETHTGAPVTTLRGAWLDESGALLLETEHPGVGLLEDRDLEEFSAHFRGEGSADDAVVAEAVERTVAGEAGELRLVRAGSEFEVGFVESARVAERFGFVPIPAAPDDRQE